jgi:flagellar biogenesis protein FliO
MNFRRISLQALLALNLLCLVDNPAFAAAAVPPNPQSNPQLIPQPIPQSIPFRQEPASGTGELLRVMGGLTLCILLLGGVLLVLRQRAGTRTASPANAARLRIVERQRLGARSALYVVEFEGKRHLLAQGEHGITLLASASAGLTADWSKP